MFCTSCGSANDPGVRFCTRCGSALATAPPNVSPDVTPVTPSGPAPAVPYAAPVSGFGPVTGFAGGAVPFAGNYATWSNRVIAYLIDFALVAGGMFVLWMLFATLTGAVGTLGRGGESVASGFCCLMVTIFPLATIGVGLYNRVYLVHQRGYSIGQGIMKLKVVDANGNLLSGGTLVLRLLAQVVLHIIPLVGILDLLFPLWDPARQTLHDKAVGSYVINNPNPA